MMFLGERIARLRDKAGLTQEELAKKIGITRAALSHYEKNRREPDANTIYKIAEYFDVTIDYLFGRTNDPKETVIDNLAFHRSDNPMKDLPPEAWEELQNYLDYLTHKYKSKSKDEKKGQ